jgi:hypothetical protein
VLSNYNLNLNGYENVSLTTANFIVNEKDAEEFQLNSQKTNDDVSTKYCSLLYNRSIQEPTLKPTWSRADLSNQLLLSHSINVPQVWSL